MLQDRMEHQVTESGREAESRSAVWSAGARGKASSAGFHARQDRSGMPVPVPASMFACPTGGCAFRFREFRRSAPLCHPFITGGGRLKMGGIPVVMVLGEVPIWSLSTFCAVSPGGVAVSSVPDRNITSV